MVKGRPATSEQLKNVNIIIQVGSTMGVRRKLVVCAIMTAIVESTLRNLPYGDLDSLGLFQQRASQGWGNAEEELDPPTASRMFYQAAEKVDAMDPTMAYGELCQAVQRSGHPDRYALYRTEAERLVTNGGIPGGDGETSAAGLNNSKDQTDQGSEYIFYRGIPDSTKKTFKKEDSWTCIQRLADDVHWRAFFVSGVFYFISEDDLIKSLPIATITESSKGVEGIDGDYDNNKKSAEITLTVRVGTWLVPPGAVIVLQDMGPWNGRWIVSTFSRSLLANDTATIVIKKPQPRLPEPLLNDINQLSPTWGQPDVPTTDPNTYGRSGVYVNPLPTKKPTVSSFMLPDGCEGVPNAPTGKLCPADGTYHVHGAVDWFAAGGTGVVAPIDGTIVELKMSRGNSGQVFGGVVKVQEANGYVWVFRHVDPHAPLIEGAHVRQGEKIAQVTTWADNPSSSHCHIEIWRSLSGGYTFPNMVDPLQYMT
jgi:murein DD-endopeptidase MepM/ murein hydrolase activator NlpD